MEEKVKILQTNVSPETGARLFIRPKPNARPVPKWSVIVVTATAVIVVAAAAAPWLRDILTPKPAPIPQAGLSGRPPVSAAKKRDLQRYADLNAIRIALAGYDNAHGAYPDALAALAPERLSAIPEDPTPPHAYQYRVVPGGYIIAFTFESGVFALSAGDHIMSQRGFDLPPQQNESSAPTGVTAPSASADATASEPAAPANPLPPTEPATSDIDTDLDGAADAEEVAAGTDPMAADTDGDGLADGDEIRVFSTDPKKNDTDGDGFADGEELKNGYEPLGPGMLSDTRRQSIEDAIAKVGLHPPTPSGLFASR